MTNQKITYTDAIWRGLRNECPRCHAQDAVFRSLIRMNESCSICGYRFEREPGYFLGAMSFSYVIGFVAVLPLFLYLLFKDVPLWIVVGVPVAPIFMMSPFLMRFSRLIYIHLDYRTDPATKPQAQK